MATDAHPTKVEKQVNWEDFNSLFSESSPDVSTSPQNPTVPVEDITDDDQDKDEDELIPSEQIEKERLPDYYSFMPNRIQRMPKILLIGLVGLPIILGYGIWSLNQGESPHQPTKSTQVDNNEDLKSENQRLQQENAALKAEQALGEQERQLNNTEPIIKGSNHPPQPKATPRPQPTPVKPSPPPRARTSTPPRPPSPPKIVYRDRPVYRSQVVYRERPSQSQSQTTPSVPAPQQDPQEAWLAAAQLGSYGSVQPTHEQPNHEQPNHEQPSTTTHNSLVSAQTYPSPQGDTRLAHYHSSPPVTGGNQGVHPTNNGDIEPLLNPLTPQLSTYEQELPILREQAREIHRIPVGTQRRGQIDHSVAWEGAQPSQSLTIRLLEPLLSDSGKVIADEGSFLIVAINGAGRTGLVSMTPKMLVALTETAEYREIPLTPAMIAITQAGGHPLMAEPIGAIQPRPNVDVGRLMLDGISTALPFFSDGTNSYQDLYRMQRVEQLYNRHFAQPQHPYHPNVQLTSSAWIIPAGIEVDIYVNHPIQLSE